jgi:hypothetical protein
MAITVSASALAKTSFNFTDTSDGTVKSSNESVTSSRAYTYGTGVFQINAAVKNSGVLPSGGTTIFNIAAMTGVMLGLSTSIPFSGIKNITVRNTSTASGVDINIRTTGSNAFTNIFNGGSGNLLIKPYSSFSYNDPYGLRTSTTQRNISLVDVSGSGATYEICVMGTLS